MGCRTGTAASGGCTTRSCLEFFRNNKIVMMTGERDTHGCDNFHPLSQVNGVPQQDLSFYGACFITRTDASCISVHQCVCKDGLVCLTLHQALLMWSANELKSSFKLQWKGIFDCLQDDVDFKALFGTKHLGRRTKKTNLTVSVLSLQNNNGGDPLCTWLSIASWPLWARHSSPFWKLGTERDAARSSISKWSSEMT